MDNEYDWDAIHDDIIDYDQMTIANVSGTTCFLCRGQKEVVKTMQQYFKTKHIDEPIPLFQLADNRFVTGLIFKEGEDILNIQNMAI